MRSRALLYSLTGGSLLLILAPVVAHAAAIPFFGPIVPSPWNLCPGSWKGILVVINNVIDFGITIAIVLVAPLMIAYSGFLFVTNPVNPSGKNEAKSILWSTVIGIVIALASWLIVNAVMAVFYNGTFGPWSSLLYGTGSDCLNVASSLQQAAPGANGGTGPGITGTGAGGGQSLSFGTGACDSATVQQAAQAGGYTISTSEANILACIAGPESSCGTNTNVAHQKNGTPTTATGAFQITFGAGTDQCHQLNIPACSQAAGWSGNLNCSSVFTCSAGQTQCQPRPGMEANAAACLTAARDLTCNTAAAACLVQADGGYTAWTADSRSSAQAQCISNGG